MKKLTLADKLFRKVSKQGKVRRELEKRKLEIEAQAKDSLLLSEYLDILAQLTEQDKLIKNSLEPLQPAMETEDRTTIEDDNIKVSIKRGYTATVLDTKTFYETYKPTSKVYQKLVTERPVKGSIKVEYK